MNYDVPLPINLLRIAGDYAHETVARFSVAAPNTSRVKDYYCIAREADDNVVVMLTTTLNRYLDYDGPLDKIKEIMGLVRMEDVDEDSFVADEYIPIAFSWGVEGSIVSVEKLPREDIDLEKEFSDAQLQQIVDALIDEGLGLKEAMLFAEHEFTDWQAYSLCKAFREGVDERCIRAFADPSYNHAQMRELARISKISGFGSFVFDQCLSEGYSASMLRQVRKMLAYNEGQPLWWKLDEEQLREANYAASVGIPDEMKELYTTGRYAPQNMSCITTALLDGMEKEQVNYLLDPHLDEEQVWCVYSGLSKGLLPMQMDTLANPALPASMMKVALYAFTRHDLNASTVREFTTSTYTPEQATAIIDAAALRDSSGTRLLDYKALFMVADPALTPQQMQTLTASIKSGMSMDEIEKMKNDMTFRNETGRVSTDEYQSDHAYKQEPTMRLRAEAKSVRDSSRALGSTRAGDDSMQETER